MVTFNVNCRSLRSSKQLSPLITLHFTTIIMMLMIVIKPGFSITSKDRNSTEINPVAVNFGQQGTNTTNTILNVINSTGLLEISNGNLNASLQNATLDSSDKCKSRQAICHTYVHNMYGFYTVFGGYFMSAVVVLGIAFLVITHFHGRHVVKNKGLVVKKLQIWDVIQHRHQQMREKHSSNWI